LHNKINNNVYISLASANGSANGRLLSWIDVLGRYSSSYMEENKMRYLFSLFNQLTTRRYRQRPVSNALLLAVGLLVLFAGAAWALGGDLLWQNQVDFVGGHDFGNEIIVQGDQVFASGRVTNAAGNQDWFVTAYHAGNGTLQWQDQFDLANGFDTVFDVGVDDFQLYIVGDAQNSIGFPDAIIRSYNKQTGALAWQNQFSLIGEFDINTAVAAQYGVLFVAGLSDGSVLNFDWVVRALDARDGSLLWQDQFDLAGNDEDVPWAITVDGPRVFVAGIGVNAAGDEDAIVRAYNVWDGSLLWQFQFDQAGGKEQAFNITADGSRVFVGGWVENAAGNVDWHLWALKAEDGSLLWQEQVDVAGGFDALLDIALLGKQLFAVGSVTNNSGGRDSLVRAYDARNGTLLWQNQFDLAGGFDTASKIAVDGRQLIVAGDGINAMGNKDWVVRAFNAQTGSLLWQDQFDLAGGNDISHDVEIEKGRVFVVGSNWNAAGNADWIIRAYKAR
jgi:hypothetical protein